MGLRILSIRSSAGTAHTNSTDEAVLDSYLIPAGSLMLGKVLRFTGQVRATATNSTDTLLVRCYGHTAASVAGTAVSTSGAVDATDNDTVDFDIEFIPRSAAGSTSGSIMVRGGMTAVGAEGTVTYRGVHQILSSINYTSDYYFVVGGDWSVASASNSCQSEALTVYELT